MAMSTLNGLENCMDLSNDNVVVQVARTDNENPDLGRAKLYFFFQTCVPCEDKDATACQTSSHTVSYAFGKGSVPLEKPLGKDIRTPYLLHLTYLLGDWNWIGAVFRPKASGDQGIDSAYPSNGGGYGGAKSREEFAKAIKHVSGTVGFADIPSQNIPTEGTPRMDFPPEVVFKKIEVVPR
jgi:hypothetical protein